MKMGHTVMTLAGRKLGAPALYLMFWTTWLPSRSDEKHERIADRHKLQYLLKEKSMKLPLTTLSGSQ